MAPVNASPLPCQNTLCAVTLASFNTCSSRPAATTTLSPAFAGAPSAASGTSTPTHSMLPPNAIARLPGIVHGVVVQMTTYAPASSCGPDCSGNLTQTVSDLCS